jgi:hypothetical protein
LKPTGHIHPAAIGLQARQQLRDHPLRKFSHGVSEAPQYIIARCPLSFGLNLVLAHGEIARNREHTLPAALGVKD